VVVKFEVGDLVVYGTHGIGRIIARKNGASGDLVVIAFEDGLTVTLPLERARQILRPLADEAELVRVRDALRNDPELSVAPWLARRRETLEKLTEGNLVQLAEIVSEGVRRERMRLAKGNKSPLSTGEKELFNRARRLLSEEIAQALDLEQSAADGWINEQLAQKS
jgi:CarD family transcriptional regulator